MATCRVASGNKQSVEVRCGMNHVGEMFQCAEHKNQNGHGAIGCGACNGHVDSQKFKKHFSPCRRSRFLCVYRPRRHVCVTHPGVRRDPSPAGEYDELSLPPRRTPTTLGTLRSHTDGVINGRRASEGNSSLISTFAPDCRLC